MVLSCLHGTRVSAAALSALILVACGEDGGGLDPGDAILTVTRSGAAAGTVSSSEVDISCGATCSAAIPAGRTVTLTATPAADAVFAGWGGACHGTAPTCTVAVDADTEVITTFERLAHPVTIRIGGSGTGTIAAPLDGLRCGAACSGRIVHGQALALSASAGAGSRFLGWTISPGGTACAGAGACATTITGPTTITATFALDETLEVTRSGAGTGTVVSTPAGIDCGADCSELYPVGTSITLTATPDAGSVFAGWSGGGCAGTGDCIVELAAATLVTADFQLEQYALTVTPAGTGAGTVTSAPAGIDCGATCTGTYDAGTAVTLTAAPAVGSTFAGWSGGGCSGTGACTVTMAAATAVTATFTLNSYALSVSRAGTGSGTVSSAPAGISCGATCAASFAYGTAVTLTAAPAVGSTFTGWSGGGCSGTGACTVTMTAAAAVTATFTLKQYTLSVIKTGSGGGSVISSPAGITCGGACTGTFTHGTVVTLTATPALYSIFGGWSGGGCSGTGTCTITMTGAVTVGANFQRPTYTLAVTKTGPGSGTVKSTPGTINCGTSCSMAVLNGSTYTLTATPAVGSVFSGWSGGGCSGTGTCTLTVTANTTVTAIFVRLIAPIPPAPSERAVLLPRDVR